MGAPGIAPAPRGEEPRGHVTLEEHVQVPEGEARSEDAQRRDEKELAGDIKASWGDQMRSYFLYGQQLVKDLRTGYEVGNPQIVFDGDLDGFIDAGIRWRRSGQE